MALTKTEGFGTLNGWRKMGCREWSEHHLKLFVRALDDPRYPKSAAYHEAGHVVVAVVQGLRVSKRGMRVDPLDGTGFSYYETRKPGDSHGVNSLGERTVISLFAGLPAQQRYCITATAMNVAGDKDHIEGVLKDMYISPSFSCSQNFEAENHELESAKQRFEAKAIELVSKHWTAIEGLAIHLWGQNETPKTGDECWGSSKTEKELDGKAVTSFLLREAGLAASILD